MTPPREVDIAERLRSLSVTAPPALRAGVAELTVAAERRHRRRAWQLGGGILAFAAAAVLLVAFAGGGAPGTPGVPALARFALSASAGAPPAVDPAAPDRLTVAVGGLAFPRWGGAVGFSPVATRAARLGGRSVTAVFYRSSAGAEIGYAIMSAPTDPGPGAVQTVYGVRYTVTRRARATIVTWRHGRLTCVLAGRGVSAATLIGLAATAV